MAQHADDRDAPTAHEERSVERGTRRGLAVDAAVRAETMETVGRSPRRAGGLNPQDVTWW
jgi:hypothetical protein